VAKPPVHKAALGSGLEAVEAEIDRRYGTGALQSLDPDAEDRVPVEVIDTGSIGLNHVLRCGGLPRGRIVEMYGPEMSGKTSLALTAAGNVQRAGGLVAMIDAEHALDPDHAKNLGVDVKAMKVNQPDFGEQGLEIADMLVRSGAFGLIIVDSVAALTPKAEIEGEMGDSHVGLQARMMSQALRKLTGACSQTKTTVIFINQLREKIGVLFGSPETTPGGKALKFYASVRLDVRRIETLKDTHGDAVGNRVKVKVAKNKSGPPFGVTMFDFYYATGVSRAGELVDFGVDYAVVRKAGAWYTYNGDQLGQGKDNACQFLRENPDVAGEIEAKVTALLGGAAPQP
jgi:recombination protein RecA